MAFDAYDWNDSGYVVVYVVNISKLFKGYSSIRELLCEHAPWAWGNNDRTLVTPESFKQFFEDQFSDLKIADSGDEGPWEILRTRIDQLVYADRKPRNGSQNDHYIDLEN